MFKAGKKKIQQNASLKNSHRNHTNRVFYQKRIFKSIDRSLRTKNYFVSGDFYAPVTQDTKVTTKSLFFWTPEKTSLI